MPFVRLIVFISLFGKCEANVKVSPRSFLQHSTKEGKLTVKLQARHPRAESSQASAKLVSGRSPREATIQQV